MILLQMVVNGFRLEIGSISFLKKTRDKLPIAVILLTNMDKQTKCTNGQETNKKDKLTEK